MDDVRAVMDAAGSRRAVLVGTSEGGPMCALFAATYPERVQALVMIGSYARRIRCPDYPWGSAPEAYDALVEKMEADWGRGIDIAARAPSLAGDPRFIKHYERYLRMSASPATAVGYARMNGQIDVRDVLPSIRVPTLILHAMGDRVSDIGKARYLASHIPGATLREIESGDQLCHLTHTDEVVDAIERFTTGRRGEAHDESVVATILFTDIVDSTRLAAQLGDREWSQRLASHLEVTRELLERFRGVEVKSTGDGIHATFDGPARAIRCAQALHEALAPLGIAIRAGLHTGECVRQGDGIEGIAVHIAARVTQAAGAGEVLVSQTVCGLVVGSGLRFEPRGERELRGVPGRWRLYALE